MYINADVPLFITKTPRGSSTGWITFATHESFLKGYRDGTALSLNLADLERGLIGASD